jgi:hypothetical protein
VSGTAPTAIFPYTTVPELKELDLTGRSLIGADVTSTAFLISRSGCQLRRLRLHFISEVLTTSVIQLLETLPSLESLELGVTEAKTIITLFTSLCNEPFLPQLQNLSVSHHRILDSNMHAMFQILANTLVRRESQTPEHVQLQAFSLSMQYEDTSPRLWVRQKLQELIDRGMSVDIRNRYKRWT